VLAAPAFDIFFYSANFLLTHKDVKIRQNDGAASDRADIAPVQSAPIFLLKRKTAPARRAVKRAAVGGLTRAKMLLSVLQTPKVELSSGESMQRRPKPLVKSYRAIARRCMRKRKSAPIR
jgi:hypothetical protein